MEKQFSQKWMATVNGTSNSPVLCLRQDAASCGRTQLNTQNLGETRLVNSGDLNLRGTVVGCATSNLLLTSMRASAFAVVPSVFPLHSVR